MKPTQRRVVITGLGLMTPCGEGWQPFWQAALNAKSSIRSITQMSLNGFPSKFAGEIVDIDLSRLIKNRKSLKVMSKTIKLAVAASYFALEDAGLRLEEVNATRFGVSMGTGIINNDLDEIGTGIRQAVGSSGKFEMQKFGQEGIRALFPLWFLKYLPNMPACHISITHGLKGPSNTITTSSAAGAQAIGEAYHVIQRGDADLILAGSADSKLNAMGISRFHLLGLLSQENHSPEHAYRPFDERHSGIVLGEGAGLVLLEEATHAEKRGAHIYGEIAGYGSSSDYNYDPRRSEDFTGKSRAMHRALQHASIHPEEIDAVLANGSGIPQEDIQEVKAVQDVFGKSAERLKVTAVKPITGHLIYGSGGVEFAAAILAIKENQIPPLAHFKKAAEKCMLPFVEKEPASVRVRSLLFNSFGFGGQNASLVVKQYE